MIDPQERHVLDMSEIEIIDQVPNYNWKVYKAALMYASLGYRVLPVVKNGKAIPPKKYTIAYAHASNKVKVMEKWFHPLEGMFIGWNIGLVTGREGGIFVLDVDQRADGVDGFVTLDQILADETDGTMPIGPVQVTPNGGKHFLFQWQEDAASSTDKIGPGIDTRGGTANACKGHIVAWPSVVDGRPYEWESAGPIPLTPEWVLKSLGVSWSSRPQQRGTGRGNENVEDPDLEQQVPLEQVERMLNDINPDDLSYEDWIRIGMAIRSQHPDEGLDVWDAWSRHGARYKANECRTRWEGFSEMGTVRMATLFYHAKQSGHTPKPTDKRDNPISQVTERMNKDHAVVVVGNKIRIIKEVEQTTRDRMSSPYHLLSRADFCTLMENDVIMTDPDKGKYTPVSQIWLGDPARRTYAGGIGLFPEGEPEGYYNTWTGFAVEPKPGNCDMFKDHIYSVVCDQDMDHYNYVMDWCADLFQNPADPKGVAVIMRGTEGVGKGTFANTIGMMCAPHYIHLIDEAHLTGQFNGHLSDSVVVFADEITWGGNVKTAGKLKGLVTERHMLLERKGVDAVIQRNLTHMLIASNSEWVIPAGVNSRRWFVLDVSAHRRSDVKYFTDLNEELDNGGREAFLHEMMDRKITANLTEAPVTEALIEQRSMGALQEDTQLRWWKSVLLSERLYCEDIGEEPSNTGWPQYVSKGELYQEYEEWCLHRRVRVKADNPFFKDMIAFGAKSKRISRFGKRARVIEIPHLGLAIQIIEDITGIKQEKNE